LRLVDVSEERIIEVTDVGQGDIEYATLSYVWGRQPVFTLRASSLKEMLSVPGILGSRNDQVAQTIRDCIWLTRSLGLRYLWIDSLCIVQDSIEDWENIAPLMDRIYRGGVVNICAAAGSAKDGIPGSEATPRAIAQPIASYNGIDLVAVRPVESLITQTWWNDRAWTFQERMLSPRSIIVVHDRVFFQCRGATWSEDIHSESVTPIWTLDMADSPLQAFRGNSLRRYAEYVELYSKRKLTMPSDRLVAFSGIAASLADPLRATIIFGLPNSLFDWALLWENGKAGKRVRVSSGLRVLPSWSWCGWDNAVVWRMSMVSSTLVNLHEWLCQRTWVVWYIGRVDKINVVGAGASTFSERSFRLGPVWSPPSNEDPEKARSSAWDGYAAGGAGSDPFGRKRALPPLAIDGERCILPTRPPLPGRLHFWTYTAHFQLSRRIMSTSTFQSELAPGLYRFGLLDARGDWCGTMILDDTWLSQVGAVLEFAAISEARDFAMEELDTWTYYIPQDKTSVEWYLFYAILLRWDAHERAFERAGLAKIYQDAFKHASFPPGLEWKEITLG
jgi:hypothetical protein